MVAAVKTTSLRVQDVLRHYVPEYLERHRVPVHKLRVMDRLLQCRSRVMGGQMWGCGACETARFRYHSCHNHHCPTCNDANRDKWLEQMLDEQLPVQYSHLVFTLPHELLPLFEPEPQAMFDLLLNIVAFVLKRYAKKHYRIKLGFIMVLHTWGQRLNAHPHVHVLLVLGGLTLKNKGDAADWENGSWVSIDEVNELVGAATLANRYRDLFLKHLRLSVSQGKLRLPCDFNSQLISESGRLAKIGWHVHVQAPTKNCGSEEALRYLASYVKGMAISDRRMISDIDGNVTFSAKNYRAGAGERDNATMPGKEFVRLELFHILPYRFRRVRKRGFFAPQSKKALARVRALLGMEERPEPEKVEGPEARVESSESNPFVGDAGTGPKVYALPCPKCGKEMSWRGEIEPQVDWVRGRHRYLMDALLVALRLRDLTPRPP